MNFENSAAKGQAVKIVGWDENYIDVVMKRPSLLGLAAKGLIPNKLMGAAQALFTKGMSGVTDLKNLNEVLTVMAKEALISPSYKEIEDAGCEFTDQQLIEIFNFAQRGVKALESFRKKPADTDGN